MRLISALRRVPLDRPPVWLMRQAGRYLPEYRELRSRHTFLESIRTPALATEITLQPLRRFPLDAAIIFADIMTPLEAMGVAVEFDPGPRLEPLTVEDIARLPELDRERVGFVAETISAVRAALPVETAVIGFAGSPVTLFAYLLEGGGSKNFRAFRSGLHHPAAPEALALLAREMNAYLGMQAEAGADVLQLFDSWAGWLSATQFEELAVPAAHQALAGLGVPTIYFVPDAAHLLEGLSKVGSDGYGVDWRLPLVEAWARLGEEHPIQGNLDPALLATTPDRVISATSRLLEQVASRPGHIFNLGHGVLPHTPLGCVEAMVSTVVGAGVAG